MKKLNEAVSRIRWSITKTAQVERVWTGVGKYICVLYNSVSIELLLQFCFPDMIKLLHDVAKLVLFY
jgi:hypothetical protein